MNFIFIYVISHMRDIKSRSTKLGHSFVQKIIPKRNAENEFVLMISINKKKTKKKNF